MSSMKGQKAKLQLASNVGQALASAHLGKQSNSVGSLPKPAAVDALASGQTC